MKDHVDMDHFTKFGAFMLNRDQAMDFCTWVKIHTNVSKFLTASPKIILTLIFSFTISLIFIKMGKYSDFPLSYFQIVGE